MTQGIVIALTPQELRALLTIARDENYQFYILLLISVCHGLRVSEAIALTRSNFSTASNGTYLAVQRLKGSRATNQLLISTGDALMNEQGVVTEYIDGLKPGELLFRYENGKQFKRFHINYLMRCFGKRAGVPRHKWFPHVAKHTAGALMRQTGSGIEDIADHLGHKNINNARVYAGNTDEIVHAAATKAFAFAAGQGMGSDVSLDQIPTSFGRTHPFARESSLAGRRNELCDVEI